MPGFMSAGGVPMYNINDHTDHKCGRANATSLIDLSELPSNDL